MNTRRLCVVMMLVVAAVAFAGGQEESPPSGDMNFADGVYFAQEAGFSERTGWKYMVTIEVENGEIVAADWNGANRDGGTDKKERSRSGAYGMVENGGAMAPWFEQAMATEAYLLETQDPTAITYTNDAGNTDAFSGATIHVREFFDLAEKALSGSPGGFGMWKDGQYHAEEADFNERTGWKYMVDITVVGGRIVAANWNGMNVEGGTDKKTRSMDGEYGMVANGGAMAPWFEQAMAAEAYLLETQDPTAITYSDDEGRTDAFSGATIHVIEFFTLAEEALEGARR